MLWNYNTYKHKDGHECEDEHEHRNEHNEGATAFILELQEQTERTAVIYCACQNMIISIR